VHRARRERQEIRRNLSVRNPFGSELSKSLRCKECAGIRGLHKAKLRRDNASESVIETQELIPWKERRPSLRRLRKYSKSEVSKISGGRTSLSIGSQWRTPRTVRFEIGAQDLTLRRSRKGDLRGLNGRWRVLEEKRRNPASRWIGWSCKEDSGERFH
jgi:hypothetical protein